MVNKNLRVTQFSKFYDYLMQDAPEGYKPWFFPCAKNGKNPCPQAILKINPQSKGSWHNESARLNKEQVIEHIKQGYNIGFSARKDDPVIIGDIDEAKYMTQLPKNTLTQTSRKRCGGHFIGWDKDGSAKINLPTDFGEMRSDNQYVLCCGSYVPFNLENEKDKKAFNNLTEEAKKDEYLGYYTIRDEVKPRGISFDDLPQFFKDKNKENINVEAEIFNKEEKKTYEDGEGKYSELFKLKVSDIIGLIPSNKRTGHPLHESDTDANWSLSKDGGIGHCWRHLVSLNAVQYLCVKAEYAKCEDAGTPHSHRGISKIKGDKKAFEVAYKEALKLGLIDEWKGSTGFNVNDFLISKGMNTKTGKEEFKVNVDKFANYLVGKHNIKTWFGKMNDYSFNFNGKIMCQESRGIVKIQSQELLEAYCSRNVSAEIFEKIKTKSKIDREEFEKDDNNLIPLSNGVWDLKNKILLPHSPDFNFTTNSPTIHNENAKCPTWDKFINETLYPEDVPVMQEWFGFNLYRRYFVKKGAICEGDQDTGKSVLLDTLIKLVGEKNKTGLSLQKITSGSDFTKLSLKNKWSNIYDDLSSKDLSDGGAFKVATGGGYISGEEKFGEYQQFKSYAKQMFATNKIPPVKDNDDLAYFGRWIVFKFDNVPEKIDPFLRDKLWSEEELSGILNWALEGLYRVLENGKFSYKKNSEEIKAIMERSGCPLVAFSSDVLERDDGVVVTKEEMYKAYTFWCEKNKRPRLSKEMLGRQLTKYCPYILTEKHKERIWKNARIKVEYLDLVESDNNTDTSDTFQNNTRNNQENTIYSNSYNMKVRDKVSEVSVKNLHKSCKFCDSKCEIVETELSKKANEKINRCVECKAIMDHIPQKQRYLND